MAHRTSVWIGGRGTDTTAHDVQAIEQHRREAPFVSTIERIKALEQETPRGKAGQIAEGPTKPDLPPQGIDLPRSLPAPLPPG